MPIERKGVYIDPNCTYTIRQVANILGVLTKSEMEKLKKEVEKDPKLAPIIVLGKHNRYLGEDVQYLLEKREEKPINLPKIVLKQTRN